MVCITINSSTMSFYKYVILSLVGITFSSCVEDEIVFIDKGDQIRFSRNLTSVAVDESPTIEVDITNNTTGEDNSSAYSLAFTSSNPEVIQVNDEGVLTPMSTALSQSATISVTATRIANNSNPIQISVNQGDEIVVGRITLSENEALSFPEEDLDQLIANGFEPRGVINNRISQIDIESQDVSLTATFFNFKNIDITNPDLTWTSDNTSVIAIDENGSLFPLDMGTATINVSAIIDEEEVFAEPLVITVSGETVIEEEPVVEENPSTILGFGTFESNSFYTPGGTFQIVQENGETRINLADDFTSGGSVPDLVIYLSNQTNTNTGALFISEDIDATGAQSFLVPSGVDVNSYSNVLIYCRRFSQRVGFGVINR